jgi:hypothetical protein
VTPGPDDASDDEADRRTVLAAYRRDLGRMARLLALVAGAGVVLGLALSWWVALVAVPPFLFVAFTAATFWVQARRFRRPDVELDVHLLGTARRMYEHRGHPEVAAALERCTSRRSIQLPSERARRGPEV